MGPKTTSKENNTTDQPPSSGNYSTPIDQAPTLAQRFEVLRIDGLAIAIALVALSVAALNEGGIRNIALAFAAVMGTAAFLTRFFPKSPRDLINKEHEEEMSSLKSKFDECATNSASLSSRVKELEGQKPVFPDSFSVYCEKCTELICSGKSIRTIQTPSNIKEKTEDEKSYYEYLKHTVERIPELDEYFRLVLIESTNLAEEAEKLLPFFMLLHNQYHKEDGKFSTEIEIRFYPVSDALESLLTEVDFIFTESGSYAIAFHNKENSNNTSWETSIHFSKYEVGNKLYKFISNVFGKFFNDKKYKDVNIIVDDKILKMNNYDYYRYIAIQIIEKVLDVYAKANKLTPEEKSEKKIVLLNKLKKNIEPGSSNSSKLMKSEENLLSISTDKNPLLSCEGPYILTILQSMYP